MVILTETVTWVKLSNCRTKNIWIHTWMVKVNGMNTRSPKTSMKPSLSAIMSHLEITKKISCTEKQWGMNSVLADRHMHFRWSFRHTGLILTYLYIIGQNDILTLKSWILHERSNLQYTTAWRNITSIMNYGVYDDQKKKCPCPIPHKRIGREWLKDWLNQLGSSLQTKIGW